MGLVLANNATALLASSITTSSTTLVLESGSGQRFPTLAPGDWYPVTVVDSAGNMEIMRCTARSGVNLTVQRGQEGTVARVFDAGARVDLRLTAAAINAMYDRAFHHGQQPISTITGLPDALDDLNTAIADAVTDLRGNAPEELDTLEKLAGELGGKFDKSGGTIKGDVEPEAPVHIAVLEEDGGQALIISGKSKNGTSSESDPKGVLFALLENSGGNQRHLAVVNSETLLGVRFRNNVIDGYNLENDTPATLALGIAGNIVQLRGTTQISNRLVCVSTEDGIVLNRLTTAQRDAIAALPQGLLLYNTTEGRLNLHTANGWISIGEAPPGIGDEQSWQDMSGSRAKGTAYQNDTGRAIQVVVQLTEDNEFQLSADGSTWMRYALFRFQATVHAIIPDEYSYRIVSGTGTANISSWMELR